MKHYIVLDGKNYLTKYREWTPVTPKPAVARALLSGDLDVSYGPGVFREYRGTLIAPVNAPEGWGTIDDLRDTLVKRQGLSFTDHYETEYTAHIFGEIPEESVSPMWDGPSNEFYVPVRVVLE